MFKVTTSTVSVGDGSYKVVAKGKGKQVTLKVINATPERHAEAAVQVLRKLDTVPQPQDIVSCEEVGDTFLFTIA